MTGRPLATCRDYQALHDALRARAEALGISRIEIDERGGLTGGYASKLLAPVPIKAIGRTSLGPLLAGLQAELWLVAVEGESSQSGVKRRSDKPIPQPLGNELANMQEVRAIRRKVLHDALSKAGKKGGPIGIRSRKPSTRRRLARAAAKARWAKAKATLQYVGKTAFGVQNGKHHRTRNNG